MVKITAEHYFNSLLNRVTGYTYDHGGYGCISGVTDPLNHTTSYTNTAYGNILTKTNPDNSVESWTRNSLDLVLTHTASASTAENGGRGERAENGGRDLTKRG